ncbi:hypothetical protein TanjilG_23001 [Lupinus angustifolius]|uniref:VQ domain-containing protein n=1 Tax=Lupinus angustifolius TaxID=3871 RepID=A0A1J7GDE0_LUPAN|nr:PREDICTED: VQ motif-containing protein 4-like [Lupinus angustifolius]OIV92401.1 hypothetical protein TanjilG_23001 [Lupinus angustifolius]
MEMSSRLQERDSPMNSPRSSNNNCMQIPISPLTPRSDSSPYPTTFVQADTSTFKHVVQMLTGSSETTTIQKTKPIIQQQDPLLSLPPPLPSRNFNIPPKKQGFKLFERRNSLKNSLMINTLMPNYAHNSAGFSPRMQEILSPSLLDFPSLSLSPITPLLNDDPFDNSSPSLGNSSEEEKAIAEKGFYLHPSPRTTTPRDSKPQLLTLFPLTSPRVSESSSS